MLFYNSRFLRLAENVIIGVFSAAEFETEFSGLFFVGHFGSLKNRSEPRLRNLKVRKQRQQLIDKRRRLHGRAQNGFRIAYDQFFRRPNYKLGQIKHIRQRLLHFGRRKFDSRFRKKGFVVGGYYGGVPHSLRHTRSGGTQNEHGFHAFEAAFLRSADENRIEIKRRKADFDAFKRGRKHAEIVVKVHKRFAYRAFYFLKDGAKPAFRLRKAFLNFRVLSLGRKTQYLLEKFVIRQKLFDFFGEVFGRIRFFEFRHFGQKRLTDLFCRLVARKFFKKYHSVRSERQNEVFKSVHVVEGQIFAFRKQRIFDDFQSVVRQSRGRIGQHGQQIFYRQKTGEHRAFVHKMRYAETLERRFDRTEISFVGNHDGNILIAVVRKIDKLRNFRRRFFALRKIVVGVRNLDRSARRRLQHSPVRIQIVHDFLKLRFYASGRALLFKQNSRVFAHRNYPSLNPEREQSFVFSVPERKPHRYPRRAFCQRL